MPRSAPTSWASRSIPLFQLAAEVALSHHERWDGSGYPQGLAGEAIPLSGRIVAIVDFFDALTMDRCYRPAFSDDKAVAMLREQRGRAFDPQLVDVFETRLPQLVACATCQPRRTQLRRAVHGVPGLQPAALAA
jgi:putative two-component system response regulator